MRSTWGFGFFLLFVADVPGPEPLKIKQRNKANNQHIHFVKSKYLQSCFVHNLTKWAIRR